MENLSPISSVDGRILKLLLMDVVELDDRNPNAYTRDIALDRHAGIIQQMHDCGADDIEFWIFVRFQVKLPKKKSRKEFVIAAQKERKYIKGFVEIIRERVTFNMKAGSVFDPEAQIRIIYPNLDFQLLGKEMICSKLLEIRDGNGGTVQTSTTNMKVADRFVPTSWVQDFFMVMRDRQGIPVLLDPYYFRDGNYLAKFVAEQIASQKDIWLKPTPLLVEGGDILVGSNFVFLGAKFWRNNIKKYGKKKLNQQLDILFGNHRRIVPLMGTDGEVDPRLGLLFHLDLYLTLGGMNKQGKQLVFLAELYKPAKRGKMPIRDNESREAIFLDKLEEWFKNDCPYREQLNFKVYRLPAIVSTFSKLRRLFSYSNCQVERIESMAQVYIPRYVLNGRYVKQKNRALRWAQKQVEEQFRKAQITPIVLSQSFAMQAKNEKASFHCLTKVIQRTIE